MRVLPDFPPHLDIEVTSRCNFNCTFCDKQPLLQSGQLGDIDLDLFRRIIDEGRLYRLQSVQLSYRGEPLLHKDLGEMIRYSKHSGVKEVSFCTNGTLLTPRISENLICSGLDSINISVQGADQETFESERLGAKFSHIIRNIRFFRDIRKNDGMKPPFVRVQAVALPELDTEQYFSFWEPLCDEVVVVDYKDALNRKNGIVTDWVCEQPWQRMTVLWDGTILGCNNDDLRLTSPGNAREMAISEAWGHEKVRSVRQLQLLGRSHEIAACDGCPYRTNKAQEIIKQ